MKEKTVYAIVGSILALSLGFFGYKLYVAEQKKQKSEKGDVIDGGKDGGEKGGNDDNTQSSNDPKQSKDSFPLKIASFGYKVQLLQSALNKLGASLTVDGGFGEKTYDAIWDYADLPWYVWRQTLFSRLNVLSKDNYEQILANATQKGWVVKNAEDSASETWLPFVQGGDDWSYNNLRM
tara:strand:- start:1258 stop:1794 length:537 start_codon:yes stop_codon:yes gene_type:complete